MKKIIISFIKGIIGSFTCGVSIKLIEFHTKYSLPWYHVNNFDALIILISGLIMVSESLVSIILYLKGEDNKNANTR